MISYCIGQSIGQYIRILTVFPILRGVLKVKGTISDDANSDLRSPESATAVYESLMVVPASQEVPLSPKMVISVSISVLLIDLTSSLRA
jgi:hypothetical protein